MPWVRKLVRRRGDAMDDGIVKADLQTDCDCDERRGHGRTTVWDSQYSSRPSVPPSRPRPDCFMPPKGASGVGPMAVFTPTWPKCMAAQHRSARSGSLVKR